MRKIFLLFSVIACCVGCVAQNPTTPTPTQVAKPQLFLNWINAQVYYQGTHDTMATQLYARTHGGTSPGVIQGSYLIFSGGNILNLDTFHYRKLDTFYTITDSTGVTVGNGIAHP